MADEAEIWIQTGLPIPYTVADGTAITKGAVLQLSDPMTAIEPTANYAMVAGIAVCDKIASDGINKLALWTEGYFKMVGSGNITAGDPVGTVAGMNRVVSAVGQLQLSGSRILGIAQETSTNGQTLIVKLAPQCAFVAV